MLYKGFLIETLVSNAEYDISIALSIEWISLGTQRNTPVQEPHALPNHASFSSPSNFTIESLVGA